MGGSAPSGPPPMGGSEPTEEGRSMERDLPLILENKGISLPNLELMSKKTNDDIDEINKEIDNLVKD